MPNLVLARLQQIQGHGRNDGSGEKIRGQHGEDDGFSKRHKKKFRDTCEKKHGQEHNADAERRNKSGDRDLGRAIENGALDLLALGEVALDVLNLHRGVVHQNADGKGESPEGHDVDRLPKSAQNDYRRQDRQGNGNGDDQSAAPAAEKKQDHQRG